MYKWQRKQMPGIVMWQVIREREENSYEKGK